MKVLIMILFIGSLLFGQILYEEHFTGGAMQLTWEPWIDENMTVISDPSTPGGDDWAGSISNNDSVPVAATYAGASALNDYTVEAWIYTTVSSMLAPYNGLCIRIDIPNNSLYSLVSDFDNEPKLRLRLIVGSTPTVIRDWVAGEIPGGVPDSSSWHKMKLTMIGDSIWAYYDDVLLPDCPFTDATISQGYFGVYVFGVMGPSSTKCDDIVVRAGTGIAEFDSPTKSNFTVYPNPFRNRVNIQYGIEHGVEGSGLKIYDATGCLVKNLSLPTAYSLEPTISWDGKDNAGNMLAPGVYFITNTFNHSITKVVKLQ
jgi:hypothetical protein